jgi:hypothetical protein
VGNIEIHDTEKQELKNCYKVVFNTEQGKKVLEDLKHRGFYNMTSYFGVKDNSDIVLYREGHRNLLLYILSQLKEEELK